MFGYLNYMDRDATRSQRALKVLSGISKDVGRWATNHPVYALSAVLLTGYLGVDTGKSLHEGSVREKAQAELTQRQSPLASVDVLGINRVGFIHHGVAVLKEAEKPEQAALNALLKNNVAVNDLSGGCQFSTLRTNYVASGPLAHIFSSAVRVEHFNNPVFANGNFVCVAPQIQTRAPV